MEGVERIALFRALYLGDLLVAVPAMREIAHRFPGAEITLIGLPWAEILVTRYPWLHAFLPFPGNAGLPETTQDVGALPGFFATAQARAFNLAVQLHGSGEITNLIVQQLGADRTAGFYRTGTKPPNGGGYIVWPENGPELMRLLRLAKSLGASDSDPNIDFPLTLADIDGLDRFWRAAGGRPTDYVCLHPGARLKSRRWPPERFAVVAEILEKKGLNIVLTGSVGDRQATDSFRQTRRRPFVDAVGCTHLGELAALIAGAQLLICNDTGVSHLAAATRTPSVVVSSGGDPDRWAPCDHARHRVLHHPVDCRPCLHDVCPTLHECAQGIQVGAVVRTALRLLDARHTDAA
jgi:ADP-heptose:LPS heptosyltransferase